MAAKRYIYPGQAAVGLVLEHTLVRLSATNALNVATLGHPCPSTPVFQFPRSSHSVTSCHININITSRVTQHDFISISSHVHSDIQVTVDDSEPAAWPSQRILHHSLASHSLQSLHQRSGRQDVGRPKGWQAYAYHVSHIHSASDEYSSNNNTAIITMMIM